MSSNPGAIQMVDHFEQINDEAISFNAGRTIRFTLHKGVFLRSFEEFYPEAISSFLNFLVLFA